MRWSQIHVTECILLEVGDACSRPKNHADLYDALPKDKRIQIVRLTPELLDRGIDLFRSRPDKDWPLTDCISFVVMNGLDLTDALTGDHHFEQAGFRALLA